MNEEINCGKKVTEILRVRNIKNRENDETHREDPYSEQEGNSMKKLKNRHSF